MRPSANSTRKAILRAAQKLFVKKGFAATSISEIAKRAKINQSLIYHHFENKKGLWFAIKKAVLEEFQQCKGLDLEGITEFDNFEEFVSGLVHYRFDLFERYPDLRRMIDWQYLESSSYELRGIKSDIFERLVECVRRFQKKRVIDHTFDPDLVLTFIFHSSIGFFKSHKALDRNVSKDKLPDYKKQYLKLCIKTIVRGLVTKSG